MVRRRRKIDKRLDYDDVRYTAEMCSFWLFRDAPTRRRQLNPTPPPTIEGQLFLSSCLWLRRGGGSSFTPARVSRIFELGVYVFKGFCGGKFYEWVSKKITPGLKLGYFVSLSSPEMILKKNFLFATKMYLNLSGCKH